jgi:glycosyltransferase involved in cell wall biosynthesis
MLRDKSGENIRTSGKTPNLKIAFLGARGIPACYGGFDTFVEELSIRLVESDTADVLVYCRSSYYKNQPKTYQGVNLNYIPSSRIKALESLFHSFLSSLNVLWKKVDVIFFVDPANAPFCALLRLFGKRVIIHTDGLGWRRRKWGSLARRYYKFTEWLCSRTANVLITDNLVMQEYYKQEYGADSVYISYGAESKYGVDKTVYKEFGISHSNYLLVVARLEPENNTDFVIEEYARSKVNLPLVVVGDSPYDHKYMDNLKEGAGERVFFLGRIDDQAKLNALYKGAYLYIHGHEVGGTNPSLLRAMEAGVAPLVIDIPFNTSVVDGAGFIFEKVRGNLTNILETLVADPSQVGKIAEKAKLRAGSCFTWDAVVKNYVKLFRQVTGNNFEAEDKDIGSKSMKKFTRSI